VRAQLKNLSKIKELTNLKCFNSARDLGIAKDR